MYHSITFGSADNFAADHKNTWDDWHLIPASRPFVAPPSVNANSVSIPGMDGAIDLTEVLTGYPTYGNRSGSIQFYIVNDYWDWTVAYTTIMAYIHGKRMRMVLEDDPGYYYEGRFSVSSYNPGRNFSAITINYDVAPYKREMTSSSEDWLWDTFNFNTGVIRNYSSVTIDGTGTIAVIADMEPVIPVITATDIPDGGSLTFEHSKDGETLGTYTLANGENRFPELVLREGTHQLIFTGHGTVSIDYRGGRF